MDVIVWVSCSPVVYPSWVSGKASYSWWCWLQWRCWYLAAPAEV
ncbi:hypothetical protein A2U01_0117322 [Trifolium medium]|uniref:Uncharacterized protein n=1 Tax=Trifolium medium TaxID=97028 RepID=A0A392W8D3_9FABA|nr:hypothetical protein [Trifolium medium]